MESGGDEFNQSSHLQVQKLNNLLNKSKAFFSQLLEKNAI